MIWRQQHQRTGNWMIRTRDLRGVMINFSSGTPDRAVAEQMDSMCNRLRDYRRAGLPSDEASDKWLSLQLPEVLNKLVELGFINQPQCG